MTKTLRASVCFPAALHRSLKLAIAAAVPRVTLNDYVSQAVEASLNVSAVAMEAAFDTLVYKPPIVRSTVKFSPKVAYLANDRAIALSMSPSEYFASAVAHSLSKNGK